MLGEFLGSGLWGAFGHEILYYPPPYSQSPNTHKPSDSVLVLANSRFIHDRMTASGRVIAGFENCPVGETMGQITEL